MKLQIVFLSISKNTLLMIHLPTKGTSRFYWPFVIFHSVRMWMPMHCTSASSMKSLRRCDLQPLHQGPKRTTLENDPSRMAAMTHLKFRADLDRRHPANQIGVYSNSFRHTCRNLNYLYVIMQWLLCFRADPNDPFSIGRADLDPLASGGGMVFDPMRSGGRLPGVPDLESGMSGQIPRWPSEIAQYYKCSCRGSVPPGARFDPIGPPRPGRNPGG